jgi:hypothetical protein
VDSSANKSVTVSCPAGKKVLSAGGDVTPGNGDVLIDVIRPNATLTSVTVGAVEDETGTIANWTVTAIAICAPPPAGLARIAATSVSSSSAKSVTATCPAGKQVVGTAGETTGAAGQLLLDGLRPESNLAAVTVVAMEDGSGTAGAWTVTAYAVCAGPVKGLQRTATTSGADSSSSKVNFAPCPSGKVLIGMGGDINSANGQVVLDAVFPSLTLDSAGFAAWEDDTGNTGSWSLTSYAICADHAERIVATSDASSNADKLLHARCPTGMGLTGAGADITGSFGRGYMSMIWPQSPDLASLSAHASTGRSWTGRAYAICSTPIPSLEFVSAEGSPIGVGNQRVAVVACPAGKKLLGAGSQIFNGDGLLALQRVVPRSDLATVTVAASETLSDAPNDWRLIGWALCADPPPGLQLVARTTVADSEELQVVSATCPAGKHLTGVGGQVTPATGGVLLDDLRPNAALTSVTVTGLEAGDGWSSDWTASAYAICINR